MRPICLNLLPRSLRKTAKLWWNHSQPHQSWADFKSSFLAEFYSINYTLEIEQQIQSAYQSRDEPLSRCARRMKELYLRLDSSTGELQQVRYVINKAHPSYRQYLVFQEIDSYKVSEEKAGNVQSYLLKDFLYEKNAGRCEEKPCNLYNWPFTLPEIVSQQT